MGITTLGAVAGALVLLLPATARAMEVGMQDEQVIVDRVFDRDVALQQFREMGGTHVRINVAHRYGPAAGSQELAAGALVDPIERYEDAIAAVRAVGLTPQVTLVWYGQDDADATAMWMGRVAARLGASVDRYSVLNEPDLTIPAADDCDPETIRELVESGALPTTTVTRRVRRYLRQRVQVWRNGKHVRIWRPMLVRKRVPIVFNGKTFRVFQRVRRYAWTTQRVTVIRLADATAARETMSVKAGCQAMIRGRKYRQIFRAAAPAIRAAKPGAQVLAGETSPHPGFEMFVKSVLPISADGWAHHPYQFEQSDPAQPAGWGYGIGRTVRIKEIVGMPLYYTEFGYPRPGSKWDPAASMTEASLARLLPRAWAVARANGVRQMLQYGWYSPHPDWKGTWNTSLLHTADGTTTPAYDALRTPARP